LSLHVGLTVVEQVADTRRVGIHQESKPPAIWSRAGGNQDGQVQYGTATCDSLLVCGFEDGSVELWAVPWGDGRVATW
jgi:hypothetical protein